VLFPAWDAACRGFDGQRFVLAWPVAQVARRWVERLTVMGVDTPFVLGLHDGPKSPLPLPADHIHILRPGPLPLLSDDESLFDHWQEAMKVLPQAAIDAIDRWDPDRSAVVLVPPAAELTQVAGRRVFGGTPPTRCTIEDKTRVDALFTTIGIDVAPQQVVPLAHAAATATALDQGNGTVWAGDNTTHIEAGARALAHVHNPQTHARAMALFEGRCKTVRIQPFLRGVPCSIQGICTPDGVALTRATEMLVLHDPSAGEFSLVGMATVWDPAPEVAQRLRAMARSVGEHLRSVHAWRGGFSVDAIAAADGSVWPTEINARMSAGLALVDGCLPGPSLELIERLLREDLPIGVTAAELEAWMARPLRARRIAMVRLKGLPAPTSPRLLPLVDATDHSDAPPLATLHYDTEGRQGVLRLELNPTRHSPGAQVAPLVEAALQLAQATWDLPVARWRASTA